MASLSAHALQFSGNTLDKYHCLGNAQFPGAPRLQYLTLCLNGSPDSPRDNDLYCWRISLWSNATLRISRDLYLGLRELDSLNVFELINAVQDQRTDDAFLYVDIIHRPSGVPIASGSHKVIRPNNSIDDNTTSTSSMRLITASNSTNEAGAFHLQNMSVELTLCDNIKHYPPIAHLHYIQKNSTPCIQVSLCVGRVLTNGRAEVHEIARNMEHINTVRIVPLYQPSLHNRLQSTTQPETEMDADALNFPSDLFGNTYNSLSTFHNGTDGAHDDASGPVLTPALALNKRPWHVTVEDCQLTSDILDLYAERQILITAGSGGTASLAPHSYLGHILQYQGHYIEKAELGVVVPSHSSGPQSHTYCNDDLYTSCLNFEVKVMENVETPYVHHRNQQQNQNNPPSNRNDNRIDENMHIEQCIICVGVLQHAHKLAEEPIQHNNNNGNNILNPTQLTTGRYEVLLYTVYSPDTELEVTLVGRIVVFLNIPELTLRLPLVPHSEPECFEPQKFHNKTSVEGFVYWCECLNRCCDNLSLLDDGVLDQPYLDVSNFADSLKGNAALDALQTLKSVQMQPQLALHKRRVELQRELQRLLIALTFPQHANYTTHFAIVCFLRQHEPFRFNQKILGALHTYFQEWLTSEVLSRLMLSDVSSTTTNNNINNNNNTGASPGNTSPRPNSRSSTPLPYQSNYNFLNDGSPSRTLSAQSPDKYLHSASHGNLLSTSGSSSMLRTRSPARTTIKKVTMVGPFDALPLMDWESVRAACSCVKFIGQSLLLAENARDGVDVGEEAYLQAHGDEIASIYSQDEESLPSQQVTDLLDLTALHEISDDLLCAVVKYLTHIVGLYSTWANGLTVPDTHLIKHYAMECVQKLSTGMELACLLLPTVPVLSTLTETALVEMTSQLASLFTILANPRWEEEDESFALALHEKVHAFVSPLLQCCAKYASVAHNSTAPMPIALSSLCTCVDLLQRSVLWRSEHHYELLLTLTETANAMCDRLEERVAEYDTSGDLENSLFLHTNVSSDANGNVWSMREAHNRPPPAPTVNAPTSVRKTRRGSALSFHNPTALGNAATSNSAVSGGSGGGVVNGSNKVDNNGYVVATMGEYGGEVVNNNTPSRGGNMFGVDVTLDSSTQAPNSINAAFNSLQQGPAADEGAKTAQVLAATEFYAEESLLHYMHANEVYFKAVVSVVDTLVALQRKPKKAAAKNKSSAARGMEQSSVGVLTAFDRLCTVVESVLVALCGGNLQDPARLKALIKSSVDSSGSPGKGLVLFIDLYCTIYRKYFDFLASNAALQSQMTSVTQDLLSLTLKRISVFQPVFLDILYDYARADKYLSRSVWMAYRSHPSSDNESLAVGAAMSNPPVLNDHEDAVIQTLSRKLSLHSLHPAATNTSAGGSTTQAARNKRSADEFAMLGAQRAAQWLQVRQRVQDTLLSAANCVVRIVHSAEGRSTASSKATADVSKGVFDFKTVSASATTTMAMQPPVTPRLHALFNTVVTQLCHACMMHDLGIEGKDIVHAVIAQSPLHLPLQQLWLLAQAIPQALLEPCHPTGSAHASHAAAHSVVDATAEQYAPLHTLVNTVIDLSKLNLELQASMAQVNTTGASRGGIQSTLDSTVCAMAQLLESLSMHTIQSSKEGVLFHLKSILKCTLNSYLLVFEDPSWGAQPVILTKTADGPGDRRNRRVPHPFAQLLIDTLRLCTEESSLHPALRYLQREYVLHTVNLKLLMCSKNHLMFDDPLLRHAPVQCRLLRSMFEKSFLGASLGNMILYGMCFMGTSSVSEVTQSALDAPASNDNLFSMVEEINELFRIVPSEKSRSTGQNSSELLSVFGCSFKAYHDLLRLLITHQQETFRVTSTNGLAAVQTLSEIARKLEIEIRQLRHCLQGLLRSGQWEVGIEVANLYLEKYKKLSVAPPPRPPPPPPPVPATPSLLMTPTRSAKSPGKKDRARSPGRSTVLTPHATPGSPLPHHHNHRLTYDDEAMSDLRPSSLRVAEETINASPLPPSSVNQSNAKRYEAIKSELHRVLDTLQNKINTNGDLRLFPHYYTVRFVSDTPWERGTEDETLHQALGSFQSECFQCASSAWVHRANNQGGENTEPEVDPHAGVFEYWLVMKFDTSSYPVCADYYEDVLALDQQRRMSGGHGQGSDFSLLSPISYHNIQAQLAMAFPAYTMLSSHQMMETYVGEGAFTDHQVGSVKLMQLFQAYPADQCEDALSPAVLSALGAIEEAKQATDRVTAQQILDTESLDGLDISDHDQNSPMGEQKNGHENTHTSRTAASLAEQDSDLVTELKKHVFTSLPATRFFAYTIMNDEQVQAMDSFNTHLETIDKSAYIHRFELAVSESSLDFTQLQCTLAEVSAQQSEQASSGGAAKSSTSAAPSAPVSTDPVANLKNRLRSKSNASDHHSVSGGMSRKVSRFATDSTPQGASNGGEGAPLPTSATDAVLQEEKEEDKSGTQSLNVFCVTPVSLALHRNSSCCTPIQVSLEVLYCHMVQLRRAHAAMVKLNEFRRTELANEPLGDVSSSDSIFAGVFTLLSNLLTMPAATCASFTNMETILESEQERIDLEWRAERKAMRQAYLEDVERYEVEKSKETKKWKKLMRPEPTPLDLKALEAEFYARPDHAHLKSLQTLHSEAHQLLCRTLQELRAFVMAKDDEAAAAPLTAEQLRSLAVKRGRRPTVTSMMLQSNLAVHLSDTLANKEESAASPADTSKSLKLKLCLYLESLFASMEIGIPM